MPGKAVSSAPIGSSKRAVLMQLSSITFSTGILNPSTFWSVDGDDLLVSSSVAPRIALPPITGWNTPVSAKAFDFGAVSNPKSSVLPLGFFYLPCSLFSIIDHLIAVSDMSLFYEKITTS